MKVIVSHAKGSKLYSARLEESVKGLKPERDMIIFVY